MVEVDWPETLMMFWRVMLGEIIPKIGFSWSPEDFEMSLFYMVSHPVEAHVDGSGALLVDCVIGYPTCG